MSGGGLPILPAHSTGRSLLGLNVAGNIYSGGGGLAAGIPAAALSSPLAASVILGGTRGLASLAGRETPSLASLAGLRAYLQAENAQR